eukprot:jgi/Ulvmu1/11017/UM007_0197.1
MSVIPDNSSMEETECPVTLEEYTETGDQQPVKLPKCGHTYSRVGVSMLLVRARSLQAQGSSQGRRACVCQIRCPTCRAAVQLKSVEDCMANLQIIESIRKQAADRASKKFRYQQGSVGSRASGVASDSSENTGDQYWSFTGGGPASCPVPEIVKLPRAARLSDGQLYENRQILFCEVYRMVHKFIFPLLDDNYKGEACHSLTDYILTNPTSDVLDFLTTPFVAFEIVQSAWAVFKEEMLELADTILESSLHFVSDKLRDLSIRAGHAEPRDCDQRSMLSELLFASCSNLFPCTPRATLVAVTFSVIDEGLKGLSRDEKHSLAWLQADNFCTMAAAGIRGMLAAGTLPLREMLPDEPRPAITPLVDGLVDKTQKLLRPAYGDDAASTIAKRAARLIANHAADADSALVLMNGSPQFTTVVEAVVDALVSAGAIYDDEDSTPYPQHSGPPGMQPPPTAAAFLPPFSSISDVRDTTRFIRALYRSTQRSGEHSGRACAAPSGLSSNHNRAVDRGGPASNSSNSQPGEANRTVATAAAGTARVSVSPHRSAVGQDQSTSRAGPSSQAYRIPPPAPIHNRRTPMRPASPPPATAGGASTSAMAAASAALEGPHFEGVLPTAYYVPVDHSGTHMVLPERRGQPVCPHFVKHGWCELGMHCALGHPTGRSVRFNLMGYPIRPGTRVCKYFMQNARCKFGKNCRFDHPNIAYKYGPQAGEMLTSPANRK